ncbi:MAG: elongator complex protein 3 [Patescibacteria group bacterium]|nr:elongator complex protein 3 [Patescibacteria group bacterium]
MENDFNVDSHLTELLSLLQSIEVNQPLTKKKYFQLIKQHRTKDGALFSKDQIVAAYRQLAGSHGLQAYSSSVMEGIRMKPMRTMSGVAPITVLTKPFPCPGTCIFCPNDIRMPKSYLADEPGAQRAERNFFDPYLQTYNRLQALHNIGHSVNKAEIIVLGGTWSYYPEKYQIWFIKECFRALNDFGKRDDRETVERRYEEMNKVLESRSQHPLENDPDKNEEALKDEEIDGNNIDESYNQKVSELYVAPERLGGFDSYQSATWQELFEQHKLNENNDVRNVGLVIETRPDNISEAEVIRVRKLGCTKTQIGFQSLQDEVLTLNKRGHDVAASRKAVGLLRQAGFKIHAHWMANLYGSSVELDKKDYDVLFSDQDFMPDELKVYPCSLIGSAELMQYYKKGLWKPYAYEELLEVLKHVFQNTPQYCRLTRVIRDIPSTDIVVGNKLTNFRQIAEQELAKVGEKSKDIRAREIKQRQVTDDEIMLKVVEYKTSTSEEKFLQYVTKDDNSIVAFLRLSLPTKNSFIAELKDAAMIREIHVYGNLVQVGEKAGGKSQHLGLGTKLIQKAKELSSRQRFSKLAVISAIGTREYYRSRGFTDGELYQYLPLD